MSIWMYIHFVDDAHEFQLNMSLSKPNLTLFLSEEEDFVQPINYKIKRYKREKGLRPYHNLVRAKCNVILMVMCGRYTGSLII